MFYRICLNYNEHKIRRAGLEANVLLVTPVINKDPALATNYALYKKNISSLIMAASYTRRTNPGGVLI